MGQGLLTRVDCLSGGYSAGWVLRGRGSRPGQKFSGQLGRAAPRAASPAADRAPYAWSAATHGKPPFSGLDQGQVATAKSQRASGSAEMRRSGRACRKIASFATALQLGADRVEAGQADAGARAPEGGVVPPFGSRALTHAGRAGQTSELENPPPAPAPSGRHVAAARTGRNISRRAMGFGVQRLPAARTGRCGAVGCGVWLVAANARGRAGTLGAGRG